MVLTAENYYSKEANKEYMSVSQYKDFAGTYGKMACEFSAVEKLEERWEQKKTTPLLVGSYVDSYFEGTVGEFKKETPEIFTQDGGLKAPYIQADKIIERMERDVGIKASLQTGMVSINDRNRNQAIAVSITEMVAVLNEALRYGTAGKGKKVRL